MVDRALAVSTRMHKCLRDLRLIDESCRADMSQWLQTWVKRPRGRSHSSNKVRTVKPGLFVFGALAFIALAACSDGLSVARGDDAASLLDATDDVSDSSGELSEDASGDADDAETGDADASGDTADTADTADVGRIEIYLAGDHAVRDYNDGLSGQTPTAYQIGISGYQLRTGPTATPVPCFDLDEPVVADMDGDTLVGHCRTDEVPTALYTHGRVRVEYLTYTVGGRLHYAGQVYAGDFVIFRAYSDTVYEGVDYNAGSGWVRYEGPTTVTLPVEYAPLDVVGLSGELVGGEYWLTFPYLRVLPVETSNTDTHWARFHWEVYEAFRWVDDAGPDNRDGEWDVGTTLAASEEVRMTGVAGYHITSSID